MRTVLLILLVSIPCMSPAIAGTVPPDSDDWAEYATAPEAVADGWHQECGLSQQVVVDSDCQCGDRSVGIETTRAYWCDVFDLAKSVPLTGLTTVHFWHKADWAGWNFAFRLHMEPTPDEAAAGVQIKRLAWSFPSSTTWTSLTFDVAEATWEWRVNNMWQAYGGEESLTEMVNLEWYFCSYFGVTIGDRMLIDELYLGFDETGAPPARLTATLGEPHPNPFNPRVTVPYTVTEGGDYRLAIYDLAGRRLKVLAEGRRDAGAYAPIWDGRDGSGTPVASGAYLARLTGRGVEMSRKVVLAR